METTMTDFRDIQHGVNDPVSGVDVKRRFRENQTPHERAQSAASRTDSGRGYRYRCAVAMSLSHSQIVAHRPNC
jgi:hypothetical protein